MTAIIKTANAYRVTAGGLELPKGSRFTVRRVPIRINPGELALFQVGRFLILGRMAGDFIFQPNRLIDCEGCDVRAIGAVV